MVANIVRNEIRTRTQILRPTWGIRFRARKAFVVQRAQRSPSHRVTMPKYVPIPARSMS